MKKLNKFWLKLTAAYKILFKWDHCFVVAIDRENLERLLLEDDIEASMTYIGMQSYNVKQVIHVLADTYDEDDMILSKAEFHAKVDEFIENKKP